MPPYVSNARSMMSRLRSRLGEVVSKRGGTARRGRHGHNGEQQEPGLRSFRLDSEPGVPAPKDFFQFVVQDLGPGLQKQVRPT